jgi:hypothetical protein
MELAMATPDESHEQQLGRAGDESGARERTVGSPVVALTSQSDVTDLATVSRHLARFMFDLQADDYDADEAMRELAWADDGIHDFWLGQASAVVAFLGLEQCA